MPFILSDDTEDNWLNPIGNDMDKEVIQNLIQKYPEDQLMCHTVNKLRGKDYSGNVEEISNKVNYKELEF